MYMGTNEQFFRIFKKYQYSKLLSNYRVKHVANLIYKRLYIY